MQTQRRSMEASSEASYCERDTWEEWGSHSSLSQVEETSQGSRGEDAAALRAERDALARALAAERQRGAAAARAHDARLAELHGVIAELVRRRAADHHARPIPEEEGSDECESTTQPAGELDNDAERSRTEQDDASSALSPSLPTPQDKAPPPETDLDDSRADPVEASSQPEVTDNCDTSLNLSERDSEICLSTARCCQYARGAGESAGSCERDHGSTDAPQVYTASPGRCAARRAKLAARVRLRRGDGAPDAHEPNNEESWCADAAERLALDVCAQADLREALVAANNDGEALTATLSLCRARCSRLQADCGVLQCAVARAADTAHRLYCACAVQESWCVALCVALRAADRALEAYDVLLALAESRRDHERAAAESVARQLLARLDGAAGAPGAAGAAAEPLLSPGPWLQHHHAAPATAAPWGAEAEARLRRHAARLKADTVSLRPQQAPTLFSYHDIAEEELPQSAGAFSMAEMEAAVMMQEVLSAREARAAARLASLNASVPAPNVPNVPSVPNVQNVPSEPNQEYIDPEYQIEHGSKDHEGKGHKSDTGRGRRRARRHWLEAQASETDL